MLYNQIEMLIDEYHVDGVVLYQFGFQDESYCFCDICKEKFYQDTGIDISKANANSYNWALPNGWTTSDNSAFALVAEVNNTPGPVELCVTATVGACEVTSCLTVTVDFNTGVGTPAVNTSDWFTVQPNPSNGVFSILPSDDGTEPVRISVHDGVGRNVIAPFTLSLERPFPLDMGNVAPGAYYLLATMPSAGGQREDRQQVVKLVVQR